MVDKKIYKKKLKVIVFGGSGFIGSHVAESLYENGYQVIVADLKKSKDLNKNILFQRVDINNRKRVFKLVKKNSVVFNFAAIADIQDSYNNPLKTLNVNIIGCANILHACAQNKAKKFILASSIYANTSQGGFYRVSKQSCEIMTMEFSKVYKLDYTILRFGSIYGPRSNLKNGLLKIVFDSLNKKKLIYRGTKKAVRSYIHVKDAAKSSVEILNKKYKNRIVLIKGKKEIKIVNLLIVLKKILKIKSKLFFLNKTQKGHYDKKPKKLQKINLIEYYLKKPINFENSLHELISIVKNKKFSK
tara:strand:+ start:2479 stop:3384 length:906 start_codon:yes stop_codon:yes gene_type:complete